MFCLLVIPITFARFLCVFASFPVIFVVMYGHLTSKEIFAIMKHGTFDFVEMEALVRDSTIWKSTRRVATGMDSKLVLGAEDSH